MIQEHLNSVVLILTPIIIVLNYYRFGVVSGYNSHYRKFQFYRIQLANITREVVDIIMDIVSIERQQICGSCIACLSSGGQTMCYQLRSPHYRFYVLAEQNCSFWRGEEVAAFERDLES